MMKPLTPSAVWILAFLGCGTEQGANPFDTGDIISARPELYVDSTLTWKSREIPICWENGSAADAPARGWVRDAISNTWAKYGAITFTGWNQCSSGSNGVRIRVADEWPLVHGLGTQLDGKEGGMVLNFSFQNWGKDGCENRREICIRAIGIHEFGHLLGFAHEQNRPDTPAWCTDVQGQNGNTTIGPWDANSVMNYCNPAWINGQLSVEDIRGIQTVYGGGGIGALSGRNFHAVATAYEGNWMGGWHLSPSDTIANVGDFNGDGKTEFIIRSPWGIATIQANGAGGFTHTAGASYGTALGGWSLGSGDTIGGVGDFNGDGKAEFLVRSPWGIATIQANGAGGFTHTAGASYGTALGGWSLGSGDTIVDVGDFNGDGKAEFLIRSPWGIAIIRTNGAGGFTHTVGTPYDSALGNWLLTSSDSAIYNGDFNGDKTTDILMRVSR